MLTRRTALAALALAGLAAGLDGGAAFACTNFLITPGASADGSVLITYTADSHTLYGDLRHIPAGAHLPGAMVDVYEWDSGKRLGQIKQAERTYAVVGLMNEHQVAMGRRPSAGGPICAIQRA